MYSISVLHHLNQQMDKMPTQYIIPKHFIKIADEEAARRLWHCDGQKVE